ncbi:hypothetical protein BCR33DRAFT_40388 [Rhizoclosmatium globosum]|uniref:Uncharacterized protein n=1 Tax=Rhizoclosmatium globosum TaxID=329046 RepID=A0A1Y2CQJ8_9FUNG|nr:hypothetical protein BCR33DRAFT_40388 [Rhizoclosmatium globosum]|eukprot:ORY48625.1 hypothetical protein BCR33DRAFT_40388 [Rhizoclosmatium globosum]
MVLISSECQPWFKERTEAERYSTIHHHIQKTPLRSLPLKAQFDANLVSHVYPNGPKAPTHVGLMTRILAIKSGTALKPFEQSELAFFTAKEEEWRQSFKSVFASLEQGHSEYFYYMNSEFTVLFQSPEFAGNTTSDYRALLTKANSGLRGALISKKIKFKMIIAPAKVKSKYTPNEEINEAEVQETKKELKEMEHLQPGRTISKTDHHQAPLQLLFTGMESLKQLHDYLLTWVEQSVERRALHQPVLISPSPFLNASIKLADIVKIEQIESTDVEAIRTSSTKRLARQTAFKLKITGFLLPTAVANIKSLIESSSLTGDHIRILMDLEERTSLLNIEAGSVIEDIQKEGSGVEKVGVEKVELNSCGKTVKTLEYANRTWL